MVVPQRVEHVLDLLASGGDHTDVAAAAGTDSVADRPDPAGPRQDLYRLDRGPSDQPGALFGDSAAVHMGVGLVVFGGQAGPAGQLLCRAEPGHVCDLRLRTPPPGPARSREYAAPLIARVAGQAAADDAGEQVDLEVEL
jgi:hypothetical protein